MKYRPPYAPKTLSDDKEESPFTRVESPDTIRRFLNAAERENETAISSELRVYRHDNAYSQGRASAPQPFTFEGHVFDPWKPKLPLEMPLSGWSQTFGARQTFSATNTQFRILRAVFAGL